VPPDWKAAQPNDQIARGKWWEIFQDPQLNALEEQVNVWQNLKAAEAQFRRAARWFDSTARHTIRLRCVGRTRTCIAAPPGLWQTNAIW
jgi:hypothetical protein